MREPNFEFYVLNHDFNRKKVYSFNIFSNAYVYDRTLEAAEEFFDGNITREDLTNRIKQSIMYEEWSRCEYEISVGAPFETDINKLEKWDCFKQALPNLPLIVDMVITRYFKYRTDKLATYKED